MKLNRIDQARFPLDPSAGFGDRVLAAARRLEPDHHHRHPARPSLLPELLDGIGWAAAVWVCGTFVRIVLR